jgi:hypothetical protein
MRKVEKMFESHCGSNGILGRKYMDSDEIRELGLLQEVNRLFMHPLGLSLELDVKTDKLMIADYRSDLEGVLFGEGNMTYDKFETFRSFKLNRHIDRLDRLGFIQQEPPKKD